MKIIKIASRIIVGVIFVFSGFVKGIDPLGSTYKFIDYFEAFHLSFLNFIALPLAILLSTGELVIGINLLLGIRMRLTSYVLLAFMSFFTILTLFLAIYNPVTDCGCFGDAIILTNWQTFWKDIIILIPTFIVFYSRNKYKPFYSSVIEWRMTLAFILTGVLISVYCYRNLPLLDFRPYNTGANIPEKMTIPDDAPADEYKTILVYEKNGSRKEFNTENFPWQDTTWKWVETRQILIKKGEEPLIHDFTITTSEGYDITDIVISDQNYSFLVIADDLSKSSINGFKKINKVAESCLVNDNCSFYCLTSSTSEEISSFSDKLDINFDFYLADEITLKTIIRSNPGLLLIKEGNILGKWHYNNIPDFEVSEQDYSSLVLDLHRKDKETLIIWLFITGFFLFISVFHLVVLKTRED
ncbi:MAG: DoxX family membrane protein [Bacteroidales bacterium]|nr:MAG: DoxX family membrane protein [Bacteroidales bacterium]